MITTALDELTPAHQQTRLRAAEKLVSAEGHHARSRGKDAKEPLKELKKLESLDYRVKGSPGQSDRLEDFWREVYFYVPLRYGLCGHGPYGADLYIL